MRKFKVFLIGLFTMVCGVLFSSCGCSSGDVTPTTITLKVKNAIERLENNKKVYYAKKGSKVSFSYKIFPADSSNTAVEVQFSEDGYVSTLEPVYDNGVSGEIEINCDNAWVDSEGKPRWIVVTLSLSGNYAVKKEINLAVVESKTLASPTGLEINENGKLQWNKVENAYGYYVSVNNQKEESLSSNIYENFKFEEGKGYTVKIKAKGDGVLYSNSEEVEFKFKMLESPSIKLSENNESLIFSLDRVEYLEKMVITPISSSGSVASKEINCKDFVKVGNLYEYKMPLTEKKLNKFKVNLISSENESEDGYVIINSLIKNYEVQQLSLDETNEIELNNNPINSSYDDGSIITIPKYSDNYDLYIKVELRELKEYVELINGKTNNNDENYLIKTFDDETLGFKIGKLIENKNIFKNNSGTFDVSICLKGKNNNSNIFVIPSETKTVTVVNTKIDELNYSISNGVDFELTTTELNKFSHYVVELVKGSKTVFKSNKAKISETVNIDIQSAGEYSCNVILIGSYYSVDKIGYINKKISCKRNVFYDEFENFEVNEKGEISWVYNNNNAKTFKFFAVKDEAEHALELSVVRGENGKFSSSLNNVLINGENLSYPFDLKVYASSDKVNSSSDKVNASNDEVYLASNSIIWKIDKKTPVDAGNISISSGNKISLTNVEETFGGLSYYFGNVEGTSKTEVKNSKENIIIDYSDINIVGDKNEIKFYVRKNGEINTNKNSTILNSEYTEKKFKVINVDSVTINRGKVTSITVGSESYDLGLFSFKINDREIDKWINYDLLGNITDKNNSSLDLKEGVEHSLKIRLSGKNNVISVFNKEFKFIINKTPDFEWKKNGNKYTLTGKDQGSLAINQGKLVENQKLKYEFEEVDEKGLNVEKSIVSSNDTNYFFEVIDGDTASHKISCRFLGDDANGVEVTDNVVNLTSKSKIKTVQQLNKVTVEIDNQKIKWDAIDNASDYKLFKGGVEQTEAQAPQKTLTGYQYDGFDESDVNVEIKIYAIGSESSSGIYYLDSCYVGRFTKLKKPVISQFYENKICVGNYIDNLTYKVYDSGDKELSGYKVENNFINFENVLNSYNNCYIVAVVNDNASDIAENYIASDKSNLFNIEKLVAPEISVAGQDLKIINHNENYTYKAIIPGSITGSETKEILAENMGFFNELEAGEYEYKIKAVKATGAENTVYVSSIIPLNFKKFKTPNIEINNENGWLNVSVVEENPILFDLKIYNVGKTENYYENANFEGGALDFNLDIYNKVKSGEIQIEVKTKLSGEQSSDKFYVESKINNGTFIFLNSPNLYISNGNLKISNKEVSKSKVLCGGKEITFNTDRGAYVSNDWQNGGSYNLEAYSYDSGKIRSRNNKLTVHILNSVDELKFDSKSKRIFWNKIENAYKYVITSNSDLVNEKTIETTSNGYSFKERDIKQNLGSDLANIDFEVSVIGSKSTINGAIYGSEGYLNPKNKTTITINYLNSVVTPKLGNGLLVNENYDEKATYKVVVKKDTTEGEIVVFESEGFKGNSFDISSALNEALIKSTQKANNGNMNSGVYKAYFETLEKEGCYLSFPKVIEYKKFIYVDIDEVFTNIELRDGSIKYDLNIDNINKIYALYKDEFKKGGEITTPFEDADFKTIFNNVRARVNNNIFNKLSCELTLNKETETANVSFDLKGFGAGEYNVELGLDCSSSGISEVFVNSSFTKSVHGIKPIQPLFPASSGETQSAFKNDGSGTIQFKKSNDNLNYIIYFYEENQLIKKIDVNVNDCKYNDETKFYEYDLMQLNLFTSTENPLKYNTPYYVGLSTKGTEGYFNSAIAKSDSVFAKLNLTKKPIVKFGYVDFQCIENGIDDKISQYISSYVVEIAIKNYNCESDKGTEITLQNLESGDYEARAIVKGNGFGVVDFNNSGLGLFTVKKLAMPLIQLQNGDFSFTPISDNEGTFVEYYKYRFISQNGEKIEEGVIKANAENRSSITIIMPNEYSKLEVIASENGNSIGYVQSDWSCYNEKPIPSRIGIIQSANINDSGDVVWEPNKNPYNDESVERKYEIVFGDLVNKYKEYITATTKSDCVVNLNELIKKHNDLYDKPIFIWIREVVSDDQTINNSAYINSAYYDLGDFKVVYPPITNSDEVTESISIENGKINLVSGLNTVNGSDLKAQKYKFELNGSFMVGDSIKQGTLTVIMGPHKEDSFISSINIDDLKNLRVEVSKLDKGYEMLCDLTSNETNQSHETLNLINGEKYKFKLKYLGYIGSLKNIDRSVEVLEKPDETKIKVVSTEYNELTSFKIEVLPVINNIGKDVVNEETYFKWQSSYSAYSLDGTSKEVNYYEVVVEKVVDNGNGVVDSGVVEIVSNAGNSGIFERVVENKIIDGVEKAVVYYRYNIQSCIDNLGSEKSNNIKMFKFSVKPIGNNYSLGSYDYSNSFVINNPIEPTNLRYGYLNEDKIFDGCLFFEFAEESKQTGLVIEIKYENNYNYGESNYTNEIVRKFEGGYIIDTITILPNDIKYMINKTSTQEVNVGYYQLKYLTNNIEYIKLMKIFNSESNIFKVFQAPREFDIGKYNRFELFAGGDGSSKLPFIITTATQFSNINNYLDSNFKLDSKGKIIDITNSIIADEFKGVLDGNNCQLNIENYKSIVSKINGIDHAFYSIFNKIGKGGVIKNLSVYMNMNMKGGNISGSESNNIFAGVCVENAGTIQNVVVNGGFIFDTSSNEFKVSGICHKNLGTLENVAFKGYILNKNHQNNTTKFEVGGICYENSGKILKAQVKFDENSITTKTIAGESKKLLGLSGTSVGGLVFEMNCGSIEQSYCKNYLECYKEIDANNYIGGLVAKFKKGAVTNCYYNYSGAVNAEGANAIIGGLFGKIQGNDNKTVKYCYVKVGDFNNYYGDDSRLDHSGSGNITYENCVFAPQDTNLKVSDDKSNSKSVWTSTECENYGYNYDSNGDYTLKYENQQKS